MCVRPFTNTVSRHASSAGPPARGGRAKSAGFIARFTHCGVRNINSPLSMMPDGLSSAANSASMGARNSMRVLVVEDDKKIASFVVNGLKQSGFAVDHCANGEEALIMARSVAYDAAIIDIM